MACATSRRRIAEVAGELRLADLLDRPYGKLSAGQKTRVSLAKALINEPELLLLDEPTASLDPDTADWVRSKLEDYCQVHAATVVLASHNMAEVERLAGRVIMLEKGRIIADETPQELIDRFGRANLEEVFLAIARRGADDAELRHERDTRHRACASRPASPHRRGRIWGMVLRYWYVIRSSWPRTAELIYWPLVQMLTWGFLQTYLAQTTSLAGKAAGLFIGGVLLWDILVRSQLGFAVAFLEEVWSRNLGHLMMSPLRPTELVAALIIVSLIKLMVAMVPVAFMAYLFFDFNVLSLGIAFAAFFANLVIMSWSLGLRLDRRGAALGAGRGELRLAHRVRFSAAVLRLLPRDNFTRLAAAGCAGASAHLRVRGAARHRLDRHVRGAANGDGLRAQPRLLRVGLCRFRLLPAPGARASGSLVQMGE